MEKCFYCHQEYHPMLIATLSQDALNNNKDMKLPHSIYVCELKIENEKVVRNDVCVSRAIADGYQLRRDLTPKR